MVFEKKRYLAVEVRFGRPLSREEAKRLVYSAVFDFLGESGASRAGVSLKEFDEARQEAVLKCALGSLEEVITALALKRFWEKQDVAIRLKKISGTIEGLGKK